MKKSRIDSHMIALALCATLLSPLQAQSDTTKIEQIGASATKKLFHTLSSQLKAHLKKGGALSAVKFCSSKAQDLTLQVNNALGNGVMIRRTSLKFRNPADAPMEDEKEVLEALHTLRKNHVALPKSLLQKVGPSHYKYYKPIVINKKVCLKCHGMSAQIDKRIKKVIRDTYLNDLATGYRMGDLRGAFVVDIKTDADTSH